MVRSVRRDIARGLRGHGWFIRLLLGLGVLALLTPTLAALEPELAGWSHAHGHVFRDGAPVDHAHPWDRDVRGLTSSGADAGDASAVTFTWDADSVVFAIVVPVVVTVGFAASLLLALGRLRPRAPALVLARIPTPPPR